MIGVVIPGFPIITGGPLTSSNLIVDVNNPKNVNNISIDRIPDDCGASLYYSVPPFQIQQFIGCICSLDPNVNMYQSTKIGVQLEKLQNIEIW